MHLHDFGGTGPNLIICHATGFHARTYAPLLRTLTTSFHVWGVDVRGHGMSQIPAEATFDWTDIADDLLAVIDHLGGEPVMAFGHSMGSTTVLLAEQKRPGTITRAWLYEPIVFTDQVGPKNSLMAESAARRRSTFDSRAAAMLRYASRPPLGMLRADALAAYVDGGMLDNDDGTVRLACQPVHEALTFNEAQITVDMLDRVQMPIVIAKGYSIEGESSAADFAPPVAQQLSGASLREYPHLGHFGPLESPDQIAGDIVEFLTASR